MLIWKWEGTDFDVWRGFCPIKCKQTYVYRKEQHVLTHINLSLFNCSSHNGSKISVLPCWCPCWCPCWTGERRDEKKAVIEPLNDTCNSSRHCFHNVTEHFIIEAARCFFGGVCCCHVPAASLGLLRDAPSTAHYKHVSIEIEISSDNDHYFDQRPQSGSMGEHYRIVTRLVDLEYLEGRSEFYNLVLRHLGV